MSDLDQLYKEGILYIRGVPVIDRFDETQMKLEVTQNIIRSNWEELKVKDGVLDIRTISSTQKISERRWRYFCF